MKRKESDKEGYILLDEIRKIKNEIPFFIYTNSNSPTQKELAKEKGAQGSTNNAQELFEMVMRTINRL